MIHSCFYTARITLHHCDNKNVLIWNKTLKCLKFYNIHLVQLSQLRVFWFLDVQLQNGV